MDSARDFLYAGGLLAVLQGVFEFVKYLRTGRHKDKAETRRTDTEAEVAMSTDARAWVQEFREAAQEAQASARDSAASAAEADRRAQAAESRAAAAEAQAADCQRKVTKVVEHLRVVEVELNRREELLARHEGRDPRVFEPFDVDKA